MGSSPSTSAKGNNLLPLLNQQKGSFDNNPADACCDGTIVPNSHSGDDASSCGPPRRTSGQDVQLISRLLLPIYYTEDTLTDEERVKVVKSWKQIAGGRSEEFLRVKKLHPDMEENTSVDYFGNIFCQRFMEVHPMSKPMFTKSAKKQGSLFFRMISFTISSLEDGEKFDKTFLAMANSHNRIGVRAVEYGIFGEVLFYTLQKTLGDAAYTDEIHLAWVKIISRILRVMIPAAIKYEITSLNPYPGSSASSVGSCPASPKNKRSFQVARDIAEPLPEMLQACPYH